MMDEYSQGELTYRSEKSMKIHPHKIDLQRGVMVN